MRRKILIPLDALRDLYWNQRKSSIEIASVFQCHPMTVRNRIRELRIPKRSPSDARMRYVKRDFDGNSSLRAYLLGFRLGDLNVYQTNNRSDLILVRCHTTKHVQVELICSLFESYGRVTVSESRYGYNINAYMNTTFRFLLPKEDRVPLEYLLTHDDVVAFIAGYIDAEGSFGVYQNRARFKVDACDMGILVWMKQILENMHVRVNFRRIALQGQRQSISGVYHHDVWRLQVNERHSLEYLIQTLLPYVRHGKRKADMITCLKNIGMRQV